MGRPKGFDRDTALKAAIAVFWKNGYEATSTDDLMRAMGIGRQSLYDTFGDKRRLYLEALQRYQADRIAAIVDRLRGAASPWAALEATILDFASEMPSQHSWGCMGINAICEFGQSDAEVSAIGKTSALVLESALERVVREAKIQGEIPASVDEGAATRFLLATFAGMKVQAKAGASPRVLQEVASFAIKALKSG